jgi:L-rhamnose mutarotase
LKRFIAATGQSQPSHRATGEGRAEVERVCFQLTVKRDKIAEYTARHRAIWPEMAEALAATGWNNYSLFLRPDGLLIGYVETDSLEASRAGMAATEVNRRWQAEMADFFEDLDGAPDEGFLRIPEIFHLDDQLPASNATPEHPLDDQLPASNATPEHPLDHQPTEPPTDPTHREVTS